MNIFQSSFLILGKGTTFRHCSEFFKKNDVTYSSLVTEDILEIKENIIILKHGEINLKNIDYIVISPGIPSSNPIVRRLFTIKSKIITDIEILQKLSSSKFICVTGTNGKTSTVNLLADILNDNDISAIACGNNGVSVFDSLEKSYEYVILEISSYQLEYINKLKSFISIVLNISMDHIDRHKSLTNYINLKLRIFNNSKFQIINSKLKKYYHCQTFEIKKNKFLIDNTALDNLFINEDNMIVFEDEKYAITGRHEALNLCACIPILKKLNFSITKIIESFSRRNFLQHRVEEICTYKGVKFINDSKSTNADSTLNALNSVKENIILIMGGDDKKISYESLIDIINEKVKSLVIIGENKTLINDLDVKVKKSYIENLEDAIYYILSDVVSGDTVLMSPGTSSFYHYSDYMERGEHFKSLVKKHANQ